jgi:hypothetical protein
MKAKILATLIVILFNVKSFSQEYFPLLDNSSWIILIADFGGIEYREINQSNDETIGIHTYKKFIDNTNQQFLLREDIDGKKIYKLINGSEVLLYDFSLQVLDNITLVNEQNYQVQSITNINVNGGQRRQFYLRNLDNNSPFPNEVWIEGVGNYGHPLLATNEIFSDPIFELKCSFQNGENIFNQGIANGGNPTSCTLSLQEQNDLSKKISFAPNPFTTELKISTTISFNNSTLKMYNSIGQIVKQLNNVNGQEIILKRENLSNGIYLIQLFENEKLLTSNKILITN